MSKNKIFNKERKIVTGSLDVEDVETLNNIGKVNGYGENMSLTLRNVVKYVKKINPSLTLTLSNI